MIFSNPSKLSLLPALCLSVAGCGSSVSPRYEEIRSSADASSKLKAAALRFDENFTPELTTASGSIKHDTKEVELSDDLYILEGEADFADDGTITLTDGSSFLISDGTQGFREDYEYVIAYNQFYSAGGQDYFVYGVGGIATEESDLPSGGTAIYRGEAAGEIETTSHDIDMNDGSSTVTADFGSGTVDVEMTDFIIFDVEAGSIVARGPIDTIAFKDMVMDGNGFSGGDWHTTLDGTQVDLTGANTTAAAGGNFFGYDSSIAGPDEVGGITLIVGDEGVVATAFISD